MMGLFLDQADKMVGNLEITEEGEYITEGVIDSGAAVTASPWSFGEHCDTVYPEHPPRLSGVDGQPLEYYGRRQVPCDMELQDGTVDMALLRTEVCNVSKLIISVSSLSDNGIASWILLMMVDAIGFDGMMVRKLS